LLSPKNDDRKIVDLLFFSIGGGKTEAYLGLAGIHAGRAAASHPGIASSGVRVLMRYTLRLLTLDRLGRAATLICALTRAPDTNAKLGDWPFEIGLWVGQAATPNRMGERGKNEPNNTARLRTRRFWDNDKNASQIPLKEYPWCGQKFGQNSFRLVPNNDRPTDLIARC
jgi:hypothetical protein